MVHIEDQESRVESQLTPAEQAAERARDFALNVLSHAGWGARKRSTVAMKPEQITEAQRILHKQGLTNREAIIAAILERQETLSQQDTAGERTGLLY